MKWCSSGPLLISFTLVFPKTIHTVLGISLPVSQAILPTRHGSRPLKYKHAVYVTMIVELTYHYSSLLCLHYLYSVGSSLEYIFLLQNYCAQCNGTLQNYYWHFSGRFGVFSCFGSNRGMSRRISRENLYFKAHVERYLIQKPFEIL